MSISSGLRGAVLALATLLPALLCGVPPARAAVAPPADLAALEQQMAQLHVNTERFSLQEELSLSEFLGQQIPLVLIIAGTGEASVAPAELSANAELLGLPAVQTRVIGETVYTYKRQAAQIDGGRPWVRSRKSSKEASSLEPTEMIGADQPGAQGTFSKLIAELNGALAIQESGPATVDDQRVIEFDATLDPMRFAEEITPKPKAPKPSLGSLFEIPETQKAPAKPPPPPSVRLELFIAPNGLPVRARFTIAQGSASITVRVDTLAINIPVNVTAPPVSKTIDEAALKRIERRRTARELRRALRVCRRLHGKPAERCRKAAKLVHGAPRGGESGGESGGGSGLL